MGIRGSHEKKEKNQGERNVWVIGNQESWKSLSSISDSSFKCINGLKQVYSPHWALLSIFIFICKMNGRDQIGAIIKIRRKPADSGIKKFKREL